MINNNVNDQTYKTNNDNGHDRSYSKSISSSVKAVDLDHGDSVNDEHSSNDASFHLSQWSVSGDADVKTNSTTLTTLSNLLQHFQSRPIDRHHKIICRLIGRKRWSLIDELIHSEKGVEIWNASSQVNHFSYLSMAAACRAPLHIIQRIIDLNPSALYESDAYGATPLHIACLNGSGLAMVTLLVQNAGERILYSMDHQLRVPLHHAVEFAVLGGLHFHELDQDDGDGDGDDDDVNNVLKSPSSTSSNDNLSTDLSRSTQESLKNDEGIDIIKYFCNIAPTCIHFLDKSDNTPIDLVQIAKSYVCKNPKYKRKYYNRCEAIYSLLRLRAVDLYREQKASYETIGYNILNDQDHHQVGDNDDDGVLV